MNVECCKGMEERKREREREREVVMQLPFCVSCMCVYSEVADYDDEFQGHAVFFLLSFSCCCTLRG